MRVPTAGGRCSFSINTVVVVLADFSTQDVVTRASSSDCFIYSRCKTVHLLIHWLLKKKKKHKGIGYFLASICNFTHQWLAWIRREVVLLIWKVPEIRTPAQQPTFCSDYFNNRPTKSPLWIKSEFAEPTQFFLFFFSHKSALSFTLCDYFARQLWQQDTFSHLFPLFPRRRVLSMVDTWCLGKTSQTHTLLCQLTTNADRPLPLNQARQPIHFSGVSQLAYSQNYDFFFFRPQSSLSIVL